MTCEPNTLQAGDPPSDLSKAVLAFEAENPESINGKKRAFFAWDLVKFGEKHSSSTSVRRGFKCVMMFRNQWLNFATTNLGWPMEDATKEWEHVDGNSLEDARDYNGPGRQMRLSMRTEDFLIGENAASFSQFL